MTIRSRIEAVVRKAASESTCQKRVTVCMILDFFGSVLSCESNRCDPDGDVCARLGVEQNKKNYSGYECNSVHAEVMAIKALPQGTRPHKAVLYGHKFFCDDCEQRLNEVGVEKFEQFDEGYGTGPR